MYWRPRKQCVFPIAPFSLAARTRNTIITTNLPSLSPLDSTVFKANKSRRRQFSTAHVPPPPLFVNTYVACVRDAIGGGRRTTNGRATGNTPRNVRYNIELYDYKPIKKNDL